MIKEKIVEVCTLYSQLDDEDKQATIEEILARAAWRKERGEKVNANGLVNLAAYLVQEFGGFG